MAVKYSTQAFIFSQEDRLEDSRVFSVFAKDFGRLHVLGKAIRKINSKLRAGLQLFSFSQIEFIQGKHTKTLTDALLVKKHQRLLADPEKFEVAKKMSALFDGFIRGQELDRGIWDFILDIFSKLNDQKTNNKLLYYYFFWNFITLLGYGPELSKCVMCAGVLNPKSIYFSHKEGGLVCGQCVAKDFVLPINADAVKTLRLILCKEWLVLHKLKIPVLSKKILHEISSGYYEYLTHSHGKP